MNNPFKKMQKSVLFDMKRLYIQRLQNTISPVEQAK